MNSNLIKYKSNNNNPLQEALGAPMPLCETGKYGLDVKIKLIYNMPKTDCDKNDQYKYTTFN